MFGITENCQKPLSARFHSQENHSHWWTISGYTLYPSQPKDFYDSTSNVNYFLINWNYLLRKLKLF